MTEAATVLTTATDRLLEPLRELATAVGAVRDNAASALADADARITAAETTAREQAGLRQAADDRALAAHTEAQRARAEADTALTEAREQERIAAEAGADAEAAETRCRAAELDAAVARTSAESSTAAADAARDTIDNLRADLTRARARADVDVERTRLVDLTRLLERTQAHHHQALTDLTTERDTTRDRLRDLATELDTTRAHLSTLKALITDLDTDDPTRRDTALTALRQHSANTSKPPEVV